MEAGSALQRVQGLAPQAQHAGLDRPDPGSGRVAGDPGQVLPLQVERGHRLAPVEPDGSPQARVVAHPPHLPHRVLEEQRLPQRPRLQRGQHQGGAPQLEQDLLLRQVGVPDDDVQPAVGGRVGVGLIPGVDDGPLQGGLQAHFLLEEVGALAQLEGHAGAAVLAPHLPRPGEHLAGDEEGRQVGHDVAEGDRPGHQVVLVGAVGVALAVAVVLVDQEALPRPQGALGGGSGAGQDHLPRLVVEGGLERVEALGSGELGVGVVDVQPGAVGQDGVRACRCRSRPPPEPKPRASRPGVSSS